MKIDFDNNTFTDLVIRSQNYNNMLTKTLDVSGRISVAGLIEIIVEDYFNDFPMIADEKYAFYNDRLANGIITQTEYQTMVSHI